MISCHRLCCLILCSYVHEDTECSPTLWWHAIEARFSSIEAQVEAVCAENRALATRQHQLENALVEATERIDKLEGMNSESIDDLSDVVCKEEGGGWQESLLR